MKRKFKITYWLNGDVRVKEIEAYSKYNAKVTFLLTNKCDDIISVQEVTE